MADTQGAAAQGNTDPVELSTLHTAAQEAYNAYTEDPTDEAKAAFDEAFSKVGSWKPAEPPAPPEKYELKLAKDSALDPSIVDNISLYAKEHGLSNEAAQALLDREAELITGDRKTQQDTQMAKVEEVRAGWVETRKTDKEIGGANEKEATANAQRAIERFGTDDLKVIFEDSGFGDHPEVVRIFARIGKAMADDKFIIAQGRGEGGERDMVKTLYDHPSSSAKT